MKLLQGNNKLLVLLWKIAGGDKFYLMKVNDYFQYKFAFLGLLLITIQIICIVSGIYFISETTNSYIAGYFIGGFFALLIFNLYRLILLTTSSQHLPHLKKGPGYRGPSLILKYGFLILFSFFISKPIEVLVLDKKLNSKIELYKKSTYDEYNKKLSQTIDRSITTLQRRRESNWSEATKLDQQIRYLKKIKYTKKNAILKAINKSKFFTQKVKIVSTQYFEGWTIFTLISIYFLLPLWLKTRLARDEDYHKIREEKESELIKQSYYNFKIKYENKINKYYKVLGKEYKFIEIYEDPPFNTKKITDSKEYITDNDEFFELLQNIKR